jgi:hypothetical protein
VKTCKTCLVTKDAAEFYSRGLECRVCTGARVKRNKLANRAYYSFYSASKGQPYRRRVDKEANRARSAKWYAANKHKRAAHDKVSKALASGKLIKPASCQSCGINCGRLEGHHADYMKPLEVVWLCDPCHSAVHRKVQVPKDFEPRKTKWLARTRQGGA